MVPAPLEFACVMPAPSSATSSSIQASKSHLRNGGFTGSPPAVSQPCFRVTLPLSQPPRLFPSVTRPETTVAPLRFRHGAGSWKPCSVSPSRALSSRYRSTCQFPRTNARTDRWILCGTLPGFPPWEVSARPYRFSFERYSVFIKLWFMRGSHMT
jgi:hypothetical protein